MKNVVTNLRDGAKLRMVALLLPMTLMPIGMMGVTTPSYLEYRSAGLRENTAREGSAYATQRQAEWKAVGSIQARLGEIREVNQHLENLIPGWQEELAVHGAVRDAAQVVGLDLTRVYMAQPERRGRAVLGKVAVERLISLTGQGSGAAGLDLVDRLRNQGWPTAVHALSANLDTSKDDQFGYDIQIGLFHYAPATDFPEKKSDEAIPIIEEPIQ